MTVPDKVKAFLTTHTWDTVLYVLGHQVVDSRHTLFLGTGSVIAVFNPYSNILQDLQQPHRRLSPPRGSYQRYPHHHRDSRLEFSGSVLMISVFSRSCGFLMRCLKECAV